MEVLRYAAFTDDPAGGNPAGVVLDAAGLDDATMLATAAEVGYSESAFLVPRDDGRFAVRYFSPLAEVPFCGHATIASGVALAERVGPGQIDFQTSVGRVELQTATYASGPATATLVSVPPRVDDITDDDRRALLAALRWVEADLDTKLPLRVAYAGAWHPIVAVSSRDRLASLDYDFEALARLMGDRDWTTVDLIWRESSTVFHARNPFPPGGIVEDPATGAAAAALGGYLRQCRAVAPPHTITIHQGVDMGRPSLITVHIPVEHDAGLAVTGAAVPL